MGINPIQIQAQRIRDLEWQRDDLQRRNSELVSQRRQMHAALLQAVAIIDRAEAWERVWKRAARSLYHTLKALTEVE